LTNRSDEWDNTERELDEDYEFFENMDSKAREASLRAIDIFEQHSPDHTCKIIKMVVSSEGDIVVLQCRDCNWDYFKQWWQFWK